MESELKKEIEELKQIIMEMKKDTEKMSSHIDFIEKIYNKIKYPLDYVIDNFKFYSPNIEKLSI